MSRRSKAEKVGDWYDKHSATEVESEPVELEVDRRHDPTLMLRIPRDVLVDLERAADDQGVATSTMARMLIVRGLHTSLEKRVEALEAVAHAPVDVVVCPVCSVSVLEDRLFEHSEWHRGNRGTS